MRNWPAITRDKLLHWAATPEAPAQLPQLIRRLILETGDITEPVRIPGGSGVSTSGFDGAVTASRATTYVPMGSSVWEMSVSTKASQKADEDYSKRKAARNGLLTSDVIYVQVREVFGGSWRSASVPVTSRSRATLTADVGTDL